MTPHEISLAVKEVCEHLDLRPQADEQELVTLLCYTEGLGHVEFDGLPVVAEYAHKIWKALRQR